MKRQIEGSHPNFVYLYPFSPIERASKIFVERIKRIRFLITRFSFFETWNKKPLLGNEIDHFECDFGLDYFFLPKISSYNIRFQF